MEEHGQVPVADLGAAAVGILRISGSCSPRTDPVAHAICRERVVIPGKLSAGGGNIQYLALSVLSQSAVSCASCGYATRIHTYFAAESFRIARRRRRQAESGPASLVGLHCMGQGLAGTFPDACEADPEFL